MQKYFPLRTVDNGNGKNRIVISSAAKGKVDFYKLFNILEFISHLPMVHKYREQECSRACNKRLIVLCGESND